MYGFTRNSAICDENWRVLWIVRPPLNRSKITKEGYGGKTTFAWQWHSGSLLLLNIDDSPTRSCFLMLETHHPQRTVWLPCSLPYRITYSLCLSETARGRTSKTTHIQANWEDRDGELVALQNCELEVFGQWENPSAERKIKLRRGWGFTIPNFERVCLNWLEIFQIHQTRAI